MHAETLIKLGLSENEAKVYLALLELGPSSTGPIIKKTGLYRVIVYDTLEKLMSSALVSYSLRKNRKRFEAEDPKRIIDIIQEKERLARSLVSELAKLRVKTPLEHGAYVYEGWKGIKTAQENYFTIMKDSTSEYLMVGAFLKITKGLADYYNSFHERRAKLKVPAKQLFNYSNKEFGLGKSKFTPVEVRFMPEHIIVSPTWVSTYKDMVLTCVADEDMPMAFLVRNKSIAESHRQYFYLMWEQGTE